MLDRQRRPSQEETSVGASPRMLGGCRMGGCVRGRSWGQRSCGSESSPRLCCGSESTPQQAATKLPAPVGGDRGAVAWVCEAAAVGGGQCSCEFSETAGDVGACEEGGRLLGPAAYTFAALGVPSAHFASHRREVGDIMGLPSLSPGSCHDRGTAGFGGRGLGRAAGWAGGRALGRAAGWAGGRACLVGGGCVWKPPERSEGGRRDPERSEGVCLVGGGWACLGATFFFFTGCAAPGRPPSGLTRAERAAKGAEGTPILPTSRRCVAKVSSEDAFE